MVGTWQNGGRRLAQQASGFCFSVSLIITGILRFGKHRHAALIRKTPRPEALRRAAAMLERLGLAAHADKPPAKLSGGERQRTAIARALVGEPDCVLADEPTGNLDEKNAKVVFDMLIENCRKQGAALILVSHDTRLAALTDRKIILHDGMLQEEVK